MRATCGKKDVGTVKLFAGFALAVIMACCLAPGLAFAADQATASLSVAQVSASTTVDTQAATATVYVVSSSKETNKKAGMSVTTVYSTNENGLLTQEVIKQTSGDITKTWTYDAKNRVTKWTASDGYSSATKTITVLKNGLPKKDVLKSSSSYGNWQPFSSTYKTKSGKVVSITRKYKGGSGTVKYQLKYKGKKLVTVKNLKYKNETTYAYDKKGNLSKVVTMKGSTKVPIVHKNTYKSGRVTKRVSTVKSGHGSSTITTFSYKKISVPKSMVKKVKAQQWAIVNGNLNFALGSWPES